MSREQKEAVDQLMGEAPLDFGGDLAEQRVVLEQIMTAQPLADDVVTVSDGVGGVPVVKIEVSALETEGVIVYFHGGAYTMGSAEAGAGLTSELARRARSRAVSVDYRLATRASVSGSSRGRAGRLSGSAGLRDPGVGRRGGRRISGWRPSGRAACGSGRPRLAAARVRGRVLAVDRPHAIGLEPPYEGGGRPLSRGRRVATSRRGLHR
jgi:hypothetical protein